MILSVIRDDTSIRFTFVNDNRMTPHPVYNFFQIVNRMGVSSGYHLQNKMTTG